MKVFVPHQKDRNIYLDEIISYSECNFIFGKYTEYKKEFEIVNIQFPEAIFDWVLPTEKQLVDLENQLKIWKRNSKIVYTLNDFKTHYNNKKAFETLFLIVFKYADAVIHLGNYSLEKYKNKFSMNCLHQVIYHPLYSSLLSQIHKKKIQKIIPIQLEGKFIVTVIGRVRAVEEFKMVVRAFNKIPNRNKVLIAPMLLDFIKVPDFVPYRFRKKWRIFVRKWYTKSLNSDEYYFSNYFLEYSYVVDLLEKTSLLIIPRIKNLNSGNLFLGLTFNLPMLIPEIGNLSEAASLLKLPVLKVDFKNLDNVLEMLLDNNFTAKYSTKEYEKNKMKFHPQKIAFEYDSFFKILINK